MKNIKLKALAIVLLLSMVVAVMPKVTFAEEDGVKIEDTLADEIRNLRREWTKKVNESEYLTTDEKIEFVDQLFAAAEDEDRATMEENIIPAIEAAIEAGKKAAEEEINEARKKLQAKIYKNKSNSQNVDINPFYKEAAEATTMDQLKDIEERFDAALKGEAKPVEPAKPADPTKPADNNDKKEPEVKPEDDKKTTVEEKDHKKAEVKEEKTEPKKEVKANTPATGSEVVLAAITFGVSALGAVVTAAKRK